MAKWIVDLREWGERSSAARLACRFEEVETAWSDSVAEISDLCGDVMLIPATTIAGLKCKAALNEYHEDIADSIVADLLGLASEVVS